MALKFLPSALGAGLVVLGRGTGWVGGGFLVMLATRMLWILLVVGAGCANEAPVPYGGMRAVAGSGAAGALAPVVEMSSAVAAPSNVGVSAPSRVAAPASTAAVPVAAAAGGGGGGSPAAVAAVGGRSGAVAGAAAPAASGGAAAPVLPDLSQILPPPSTPESRVPSPSNPAECPAVAPENPIGDCLGLPIYVECNYGTYTCICDWYHWLCAG